jgi:hypothetical protein
MDGTRMAVVRLVFSITMTKTWDALGVGVWAGNGVGDGVVTVAAGGDTHDTARAMTSASLGRGRIATPIVSPTSPIRLI